MTPPKEDTMLIAKSYTNITNALKMMEAVRDNRTIHHSSKNMLNNAINRLSWCLKDIMCTLTTPEAKDAFNAEIASWDSLAFEEVQSEMILMPVEQRLLVAPIVKAYRRGELQLIEEPQNN